MKKILLIIYTFFTIINLSYATSVTKEDKCIEMTDFKKYECYVKNVCEIKYKNPKENPNDNKIHFQTEPYKQAFEYENDEEKNKTVFLRIDTDEKVIKQTVWNYKENMNWIYKCGLLATQYNSLLKIQKKLKQNAQVKENIIQKIDEYLQKIEIKMNSWEDKCKNIDKKEPYQKYMILKEVTLETCKYRYYMDYLWKYYNQTQNLLNKQKNEMEKDEWTSIKDIEKKFVWMQNIIQKEIEASYKIFPIAFARYSEYENNFPIHILLLLIKEDYIVLRKNLHAVLNPLNQVVYKISNAMSK